MSHDCDCNCDCACSVGLVVCFFVVIQIIDTSRDSMTWGHTTIFVHRRRG